MATRLTPRGFETSLRAAGLGPEYERETLLVELPDGGTVEHDLLRPQRTGPSVIVIHEAMGMGRSVFAIADRLREAGMTPILPILAGDPLPRGAGALRVFWRLCTRREFGALVRGEATPTAAWLRALAAIEHEASDGAKVGVIGMCFSGGYALATALEPVVAAAVVSQPAFPWALPGRRRELGVNAADLPALRRATDDGACVRALRYQRDPTSPGVRHDALHEVLPKATLVEVPTWNPIDHPVLSDATRADGSSRLQSELTASIEFLRARLVVPSPAPAEGPAR